MLSYDESDYEPEGRLVRRTEVTLYHGNTERHEGVLGWCWSKDPNTGHPRKLWGLADAGGTHMSSMSYLWGLQSAPPTVVASLIRGGQQRFVFHAGIPVWITTVELLRAFRLLGMAAPEKYQGVPVPRELVPNWDQLEAEWWRRGVKAANEHAVTALENLADEISGDE